MSADPESPEVIERAQADIASGRLWNAANRLQSYLVHDAAHPDARLLLGQLLLDMGDAVDAGRILLASERDDDVARDAIAAWLKLLGEQPDEQLALIRSQGLTDQVVLVRLGPIGRARVEPIAARAGEESEPGDEPDEPEPMNRFVAGGCALGCGGIVAVFAAGIVQIFSWLGL